MASILKSSLEEELLNGQEKAVLRKVYRASQLSEGIAALEKVRTSITAAGHAAVTVKSATAADVESIATVQAFLARQALAAIATIRLPAIKTALNEDSTHTAKHE